MKYVVLTAAMWLVTGLSVAAMPDVPLPAGAAVRAETVQEGANVRLPSGPFLSDGSNLLSLDGRVSRTAWQVNRQGMTPLQLLTPIREALMRQGFAELFACADAACGGFDFRFSLDLIPEPDMHVDFGNYRYVLAVRDGTTGPDHVAVVTSQSRDAGHIHVTFVTAAPATGHDTATPEIGADREARVPEPALSDSFATTLLETGHIALDDLRFPSGSASLSDERYQDLTDLAAFLRARPTARVVLVGHTDAIGGRAENTRLSRARADAVRRRLIGAYDIPPRQLDAAGAGYLAPRASNLSPKGRDRNRRVEVILIALE